MSRLYYRPIPQTDRQRSDGALRLAGGAIWFDQVECLARGEAARVIPATALPPDMRARLTAPRPPLAGLDWSRPRLMGILNATPDSFSDGGQHEGGAAVAHAEAMQVQGADIIDIGGESTRPGADFVPEAEELARVMPAISALRQRQPNLPLSVDTRKAGVAEAALAAGVALFNDVSALTFDPASLKVAARARTAVCLMHAQGDPATMQDAPAYEDVLLDVYDFLEGRIVAAEAAGIPRARIMVDPGIGFGKTEAHNLALIRNISLFHGLGCPILLGASRKGFIGRIGEAPLAADRAPGSIAVALEGLRQGVQMLRVHDVAETAQAVRVWRALQ
ncbi:MAG: dihydropteroate synthase [Pseudomonadota bacterium]